MIRRSLFLVVVAGFGVLAALSIRANLADLRSLRYQRTEGVITVSEVGPRLESGRYAWRLEYAYTVGGRECTGTRFNPGRHRGFKSESWGRSTVKSYPPGRKVLVYYDPADPAEAALDRATLAGILGGQWFLSGPLLIGLVLAWVLLLGGPAVRFEAAAGAPLWAVRLPAAATFQSAGNVAAITYLVGLFLVCLSGSVADPAKDDGGERAAAGIAIAAWAVYLVVIAACVWRVRVTGRLEIDPAAGTLRYRPRWFWPPPVTVPRAAVRAVEVAERTFQWKDKTEHRYRVRIGYESGGRPAVIELPEHEDRADADALAGWVRERLSVLVPPQGA